MKEGCPWSLRSLPQKCLLSGGREPGGPVHMGLLALTGRAGPGAGQADKLSERAKDVTAPLRIRKTFQILWTPGLRPLLAGLLGPLPLSRTHGFLGHQEACVFSPPRSAEPHRACGEPAQFPEPRWLVLSQEVGWLMDLWDPRVPMSAGPARRPSS